MRRPHAGARRARLTAAAGAALALRAVAVAAVAASAWWVVGLPPFSGEATAAVVLAGVAAAAAGSRLPRRPVGADAPRQRRGLLAWAVLVAAAAGWQLAAWLQHPRSTHPTLSSLANAVLDSHPARAAAFVLWLGAMAVLARP